MVDSFDVKRFVSDIVSPTLTTDNYLFVVVCGRMGGGKSTLMIQIALEYSRQTGMAFGLDGHLTWSRKQLIEWIDGVGAEKIGRKPEYSVIICDELISMFFSRNFSDKGQKSAIELLNKCRDRHIIILGAIPVFWDIDKAIRELTSLYIFNYKRGVSYIYQPEDMGFNVDIWNLRENFKILRKNNTPYKSRNFLGVLYYDDIDAELKKQYLLLRNTRRLGTENQDKNNDGINNNDKKSHRLLEYS